MRRRRLHKALALLALLVGALACGRSATFDGAVFRSAELSFRVAPIPAGWRRVDLPSADLAFRDEAHDASILVNSRCGASDHDAPLVSLTEHLIMGTTDRHFTREETVPFDGREARHTLLDARLDGVGMRFDIFVLKKDGCVFDLVHVAPATAPGSGEAAAEFEGFAGAFHAAVGPT